MTDPGTLAERLFDRDLDLKLRKIALEEIVKTNPGNLHDLLLQAAMCDSSMIRYAARKYLKDFAVEVVPGPGDKGEIEVVLTRRPDSPKENADRFPPGKGPRRPSRQSAFPAKKETPPAATPISPPSTKRFSVSYLLLAIVLIAGLPLLLYHAYVSALPHLAKFDFRALMDSFFTKPEPATPDLIDAPLPQAVSGQSPRNENNSAESPPKPSTAEMTRKIFSSMSAGDLERAETLARSALRDETDPRQKQSLAGILAGIVSRQGNPEEALRILEDSGAEGIEATAVLARIHHALNRWRDSISAAESTLNADNLDPDAAFFGALSAFDAGNTKEFIRFSGQVKAAEKSGLRRGIIESLELAVTGNTGEAFRKLSGLNDLAGEDQIFLKYFGLLEFRAGYDEDSFSGLESYLSMPREFRIPPKIKYELALAFNSMGMPEKALEHYISATTESPDLMSLPVEGIFEKALETLKVKSSLCPGDGAINYYLAWACYFLDDTDAALKHFKVAVKAGSGNIPAKATEMVDKLSQIRDHAQRLAALEEARKNENDAKENPGKRPGISSADPSEKTVSKYGKIGQDNPDDEKRENPSIDATGVARHIAAGQDFIEDGDFDSAIGELKKALDLNPESRDGAIMLAKIYAVNLVLPEEGIRYYSMAYRMNTRDQEVPELIGELYSKMGSTEKAAEWFTIAMSIDRTSEIGYRAAEKLETLSKRE